MKDKYFNCHRIRHFKRDYTAFNFQPPKKKVENTTNYYQPKKNCTHI